MNRHTVDIEDYTKTIIELQSNLQEVNEELNQAYTLIDELEFELSDVLV